MNWKFSHRESPMPWALLKKTVPGLMLAVILFTAGSAASSEQWISTYGNAGEKAYSVQNTKDGGYIFAGETNSDGYMDAWLVKTDEKGNEQWNRTFGGAVQDYAYSVQQTNDGGYIIAGETISYGARNYNAWLIKTDERGNEQWNTTFGKDGLDAARIVQITKDSGYILVGYTSSYGAGGEDIWVIKTDVNGKEEWNRTYGGVKPDEGYFIQQTSDGGYIISGMTQSFGNGAYLIKTDASGREEWKKGLEVTGIAYSVKQTKDGGYIVAGEKGSFWDEKSDAWLIKTDPNGSEQWGKNFGGSRGDTFYTVQQTLDEGYILGGATKSYGSINGDIWVVKTDSEGTEEWNRTIGGKGANEARFVLQVDDDYIIAGMYSKDMAYHAMIARISGNSSVGLSPDSDTVSKKPVVIPGPISVDQAGNQGNDAWLVRTDPDGNELWNRTFRGEFDDYAASIQETQDGYIIAGYSTMDRPGYEVWLMKTGANGNELWKKNLGENDEWLASSLVQTSDGGYVLTGKSEDVNSGDVDALLIRTGPDGNKLWRKTFGGDGYDRTLSVLPAKDGGFILSGYTESGGLSDAWVIKTDAKGTQHWSRAFGGSGSDTAGFVRQASDGNYILMGQSVDQQGNGSDIWLIKIDPDGNELWGNKTIENTQYYSVRAVQNTNDGGLVLAGPTSRMAGSEDVFLIKVDTDGNVIWRKIFKGNGYNEIYSVVQALDGGYALSGLTSGSVYDGWLIKTDASGDNQWGKTFGGHGPDEIRAIRQTSDGGFILAGSTSGFNEPVPEEPGFGIIIAIICILVVVRKGGIK